MAHHSFSFLMHANATRVDDGCQGITRLVVESVDKRQRIVSLARDGHFGVIGTNSTIPSKSYVRL